MRALLFAIIARYLRSIVMWHMTTRTSQTVHASHLSHRVNPSNPQVLALLPLKHTLSPIIRQLLSSFTAAV